MIGLKRKTEGPCPDCTSKVELFQIDDQLVFEMCENISCDYPFNQPNAEGLIHEYPYNATRYSKKPKTHSSSVANNVAATSKASDVEENCVKSVKESRPVIPASGSLSLQKDKVNLEGQTPSSSSKNELSGENITQNICQVTPPTCIPLSLPGNIALPSPSAARTVVQTSENTMHTTGYSFLDIESFLNVDLEQAPDMDKQIASTNNSDASLNTAVSNQINGEEQSISVNNSEISTSSQNTNTFTQNDNTENKNPIHPSPVQTHETISDLSSPSSATINTPKDTMELNWMDDINFLYGTDMAQSKFDPLQTDEFDSFLGV